MDRDGVSQGLLSDAEPISGHTNIDIPPNLQGRIQGLGGGAAPGAEQQNIFQQSSHPTVLLFHLLFRTLAILFYVFLGTFSSSFVFVFVVTILALSFDFWTVKNVSGRFLVGLRWWNEVAEDGSTRWTFEAKQNRAVNPVDSRVFWTSLYVYPLVWLAFIILAILKLSVGWALLCGVAIALNVTNVLGYRNCDKDANARLAGYLANSAASNSLLGSFVGSVVSNRFASFMGGSATSGAVGGATTMRV
ncbi:DUF846-domain-containing protein [Gonapodya prolifera JEL478]|uniref:Golgi apparatus membrane protein TVP23 n=1 Tax=Gonapodya prolifera (strain JEL478) TaxID=1344416 RepID=A0A139AAA2_GONPJ|nr:DUF846-domain-containing protein [Gonapodya prolifera JEL478]|eukprot:KXS13782.1 DUF846-domain-containing protein [Gonapodya prolifera JEL478]